MISASPRTGLAPSDIEFHLASFTAVQVLIAHAVHLARTPHINRYYRSNVDLYK